MGHGELTAVPGKLLRLQKISDNPEKRPYPYPEQYRYWCENIKPFFSEKDDLVSVDLVHLGPGAPQLLDDVSDLLRQLDGAAPESDPDAERPESSRLPGLSEHLSKRREKFWGSRLARVEYGMLVDDMRVGMLSRPILIPISQNTADTPQAKRMAS